MNQHSAQKAHGAYRAYEAYGAPASCRHYGSQATRLRILPYLLLVHLLSTPVIAEEPLNVGFLVLDRVYNSELMAPYDIFHHTVFHTKPGMRVFTVSQNQKKITTFEGLRVEIDYTFEDAPGIDILVIPSAEHNMDTDLKNIVVRDWVRKISNEADFVVTLCDGAFILANTGLLNQKSATTFPSDIEAFRKAFPDVKTMEGFSFVRDGRYLTSQGGARSYDVAMYVVSVIYGDKVAAGVGRGMVLSWPQEGVKYFVATK